MKKTLKIRNAGLNDLADIVEIDDQAVAVGKKTADTVPVTVVHYKKWFKAHTPEKYPIFIAEEENKILGYWSISPYRPGRLVLQHTAEVSYYIHVDYHRQGIASKLLRHAIQICPALQIKTLFAILLESNYASIKLLEKFGFEHWGHLPRVADFDSLEIGHLY